MIAFLMGLKRISPRKLNELRRETEVVIFDVNSLRSWQNARVPGAVHLDPDRFTKNDLPAPEHSVVVFYCSNPWCRKAPRAARRAESMGFERVHVMSAGIDGWRAAQMPTESGV